MASIIPSPGNWTDFFFLLRKIFSFRMMDLVFSLIFWYQEVGKSVSKNIVNLVETHTLLHTWWVQKIGFWKFGKNF
jgi:hypothetical protein